MAVVSADSAGFAALKATCMIYSDDKCTGKLDTHTWDLKANTDCIEVDTEDNKKVKGKITCVGDPPTSVNVVVGPTCTGTEGTKTLTVDKAMMAKLADKSNCNAVTFVGNSAYMKCTSFEGSPLCTKYVKPTTGENKTDDAFRTLPVAATVLSLSVAAMM